MRCAESTAFLSPHRLELETPKTSIQFINLEPNFDGNITLFRLIWHETEFWWEPYQPAVYNYHQHFVYLCKIYKVKSRYINFIYNNILYISHIYIWLDISTLLRYHWWKGMMDSAMNPPISIWKHRSERYNWQKGLRFSIKVTTNTNTDLY